MILLLLKVTLLLVVALGSVTVLNRWSAALRHLICTCALAGTLLLPLTLLLPPQSNAFLIDPTAVFASSNTSVGFSANWRLSEVLLAVWIAGSTALLLRIAAGCFLPLRLQRSATPLSVDGPVPVFSADVSVPLICGLVRPKILLPRSAGTWRPEQIEAALHHELQHFYRNDLWTMLIARLACAIYWFHPLAWIVSRQSRQEQESACDDAVLLSGFEPDVYAEALLAAARQISSTNVMGCYMLTSNVLKLRITRLFDGHLKRNPSRASLRGALALSLFSVLMIGMMVGTDGARAGQEQVYKVGNGVTAPRVIFKVDPGYSPEAEAGKIEGTVLLTVVIGPDGLAKNVEVVRPLGFGLDQKAVEAVQQWKFEPGTKDGQPVSVRATIEMNFRRI